MEQQERFEGCLLGLACGDALGAQVEFRERGAFETPTEMLGGGPFELGPGEWTDDTSMALCLAESLLHCRGFDAVDQMNRYCNWMNYGYLSSNGSCFDIGVTTSVALRQYIATGEAFAGSTNPNSAGNGSLMRLAPVAMFWLNDLDQAITQAGLSSKTTHGAVECIEACQLYAEYLIRALKGTPKTTLFATPKYVPSSPSLQRIASGEWQHKTVEQIASSGYVVHSIEAALWCVHGTSSFEEAILTAIRLGDDTDTTAAITGQLAGALHGVSAIPERWLSRLVDRELIASKASALYDAANAMP
ncbi:ADP-ribosylglycohydrolase family protein [Permianibacter sp. IMCC34836]|uniref:ADP-ribosylglycohydrolase family protein n=1 Tax=Permianibacter fluminis TaxID=2738515 RepID=UPI001557704C|nr:ADP-ribosylglycohydrolase family protein [Permianibacter fluminis]NQD35987.1 ADP-ribosylglycohydrolase family protein [Permianibacter fluminis]